MEALWSGGGESVEVGEENFEEEVLKSSLERVVLVDFWAEWCEPCRQLGPLLEEVVGKYGDRVKLVKVDVDKHGVLAEEMRVKSLPSVYCFVGGRAVDGFVGVKSKGEVVKLVEGLLTQLGGEDEVGKDEWERVEGALREGDDGKALGLLTRLMEEDGENKRVRAVWVHTMLRGGHDWGEVSSFVVDFEDEKEGEVGEVMEWIRNLRMLDEEAAACPSLVEGGVEGGVEVEGLEMLGRYELALALIGERMWDRALEVLLGMIKEDRDWREGAAREVVLKVLSGMGKFDGRVPKVRLELSNILFA